ncbi:hypothetical protein WI37_02645 [Burkholderia ubonensis]|nr:hypothetical protein WI37_02645 [Burkholderia ubonensis]
MVAGRGSNMSCVNRKLIHRYIDGWEYPDGRIEIRADGAVLSCRQYDNGARRGLFGSASFFGRPASCSSSCSMAIRSTSVLIE